LSYSSTELISALLTKIFGKGILGLIAYSFRLFQNLVTKK
jgi:hypothetical protein